MPGQKMGIDYGWQPKPSAGIAPMCGEKSRGGRFSGELSYHLWAGSMGRLTGMALVVKPAANCEQALRIARLANYLLDGCDDLGCIRLPGGNRQVIGAGGQAAAPVRDKETSSPFYGSSRIS